MALLDQMEEVSDLSNVKGLKAQASSLEQRVNLLEAYLQSPEGRGGKASAEQELKGALDQLSGAVQSTLALLQRLQEGQRRGDEGLKSVQEKLQLLERSVQALSLKSA